MRVSIMTGNMKDSDLAVKTWVTRSGAATGISTVYVTHC